MSDFRFLSLGAGIQSTALMLVEDFDEVIFADTGAEKPETYDYIEHFIRPYLASKGTPFKIVRKKKRDGSPESIIDYCLRTRNIPSIRYRWSTRDFKIRPMQRYIRSKGLSLPVRCAVGISTDEIERVKVRKDLPEWKVEYPLIERNLSRSDCERIILEKWPRPVKSGCFICPFQPDIQWRDLHDLNPKEYAIALKVEENARLRRPTITFNGRNETLPKLMERMDSNLALFTEKPCTNYCMT